MSAPSPLASQALAREVLEQVKVIEDVASTLDALVGYIQSGRGGSVALSRELPRLLAVMNRLRWACNQYANTIQGD